MFFKRAKKAQVQSAAASVPTEIKADLFTSLKPVDVDKLRRNTPTNRLTFKSTSELTGPAEPFDLKRVQEALRVALAEDARAHVFVAALPHAGAVNAVASYVATLPSAVDRKATDWVNVRLHAASGFTPIAVAAGQGQRFCDGVRAVVAQLRTLIPYLMHGEDIKLRLASIEAGFDALRDEAFARLRGMAEAQNVAILTTPMGFAVAPMHEGNVVKPEVLSRLPEAMREDVRRKVESVEAELQALLSEVPAEASGRLAERAELICDYIRPSLTEAFSGLAKEFDSGQAAEALKALQADILHLASRDAGLVAMLPDYVGPVLGVEPSGIVAGATDHASLASALVRAGRGIIVIDADGLEPSGWTTIKAALRDDTVVHPEFAKPLPFRASLILVGDARVTDELDGDAGLARHFHARAAFAPEAARSEETEMALARSLAAAIAERGLLPMDHIAVARLVGEAARNAGRPGRLSGDLAPILTLASVASRLARSAGRKAVGEADVDAALTESRATARVQPLFSTAEASAVGRVHAAGLAADPVEIFATVRPGQGRAADIACAGASAETSGSSAALFWSYLAARYVPSAPLALAAAVVQEPPATGAARASAAELYALLSALAEAPVQTTFVSIGWVSPSGALLPVAAVNAAIESAFDHFAPRDAGQPLSIVIPRANETDLMLRTDVVEAARKGRLQLYSAASVDEGLALLTGMTAGTRTGDAPFPEGTLNRMIDDRLARFARSGAAEPVAPPAGTRGTAKATAS